MFLLARRKKELENTKRLVEAVGGRAEIVVVDLANSNVVIKAIELIRSQTSKVDLLVNIAGVWHGDSGVYAGTNYESFPTEVILTTIRVGVTAPMLLVHGLLPAMKQGATIVNLSGTFENGAKGWLPYYVSKRAMEDLTVGLTEELSERGVRVYGVSPSDTATEAYAQYFPQYLDEAIDPRQIANKIISLAGGDEKSGQIWVMKKGQEPRADFHY